MKRLQYLLLSAVAMMTTLSVCGQQRFSGTFSNGYKGAKLSFVLSADKKTIKDLTFSGYWRCSGSIENITAGPQKPIPVKSGVLDAVVTDPEGGGASAFRFALKGTISGTTASGTFRMSITGLGCDTYVLNWTAQAAPTGQH